LEVENLTDGASQEADHPLRKVLHRSPGVMSRLVGEMVDWDSDTSIVGGSDLKEAYVCEYGPTKPRFKTSRLYVGGDDETNQIPTGIDR